MQKTYSEDFVIRTSQTDFSGRLKPSCLMEIMQEMAGVHAELLNMGRRTLLNMDLAFVLTRVEVHMTRYPAAGEVLHAETFPMPNRRWFFPRYFIFRNEAGEQIGCAGSLWVLLNMTDRRMAKPDPVMHLIPDNSDLTAPLGLPALVTELSGTMEADERLPVYTDLDVNGHVNNTKYLDWCCNALGIDTMREKELCRFALNFNQEILPGQAIRTELRRLGDEFSFSGFRGEKRHFDVGGMLTNRS